MRDTIDINSNDNALFITSQCNNRCVMCCQPPLLRNDLEGYFQKNMALIDSAPRELRSLGITGGEPTPARGPAVRAASPYSFETAGNRNSPADERTGIR